MLRDGNLAIKYGSIGLNITFTVGFMRNVVNKLTFNLSTLGRLLQEYACEVDVRAILGIPFLV